MFKFQFDLGQPSEHNGDLNEQYEAIDSETLAEWHSWDEFEPIRISYSTHNGVPRRDLFDVRYQLMQSDSLKADEKILLSDEDVRQSVYEGGLKVWEGTNDLLKVIEDITVPSSVIELGCGAGIPSCYLILRAIQNGNRSRFVLADYNSAVLSLVTMPNVVLAWLSANNQLGQNGEVEITQDLVQEMRKDLECRGISVAFVRGAWSSHFSELVGRHSFDLLLASETIYSLDTIGVFTKVLKDVLSPSGRALVAAKKVYFGVGGSVVEFQRRLELLNMQHRPLLTAGEVGRVVLEAKSKNISDQI